MPYNDEHSGLEVISLAECARLLETTEIGRIAVQTDDGPRIFPVNYHWDGEAIVFRTSPGSTLAAAEGQPCAFEVDHADIRARRGWSVIALGVPQPVNPDQHPETLRRLERLALYPWVEGSRDLWFRLVPAPLTGRRTPDLNTDGG